MSSRLYSYLLTALLACTSCAGGNTNSTSKNWDDIDYSRVKRAPGSGDVDSGYVQPSVVGCVNDDLYLCR